MTVFLLKIIATVSMVLDHAAYAATQKWLLSPYSAAYTLNAIGRIAFPVYCFLLVNGFQHSSDRRRYVSRLILFAVISQIPFSLMCGNNYHRSAALPAVSLSFAVNPVLAAVLIALVCVFWYRYVLKDSSALYLGLMLGMASVRLDIFTFTVLADDLNVFYTLAFGLAAMCIVERLKSAKLKDSVYLCALALLALTMWLYIMRCDYDIRGVVLILMLYAARSSRPAQALLTAVWCWFMYSGFRPVMLYCSLIAPVLILLYNGRRGKSFKLGFYLIYPIHILIISLLFIFAL